MTSTLSGTRSRGRFRYSPHPFDDVPEYLLLCGRNLPSLPETGRQSVFLCRWHGRRESAPQTGTCSSSSCRSLLRRLWRCPVVDFADNNEKLLAIPWVGIERQFPCTNLLVQGEAENIQAGQHNRISDIGGREQEEVVRVEKPFVHQGRSE